MIGPTHWLTTSHVYRTTDLDLMFTTSTHFAYVLQELSENNWRTLELSIFGKHWAGGSGMCRELPFQDWAVRREREHILNAIQEHVFKSCQIPKTTRTTTSLKSLEILEILESLESVVGREAFTKYRTSLTLDICLTFT